MNQYLGYEVEWTDNDAAPAIFKGPRGAVYGAMRYRDSEWCFIVDLGPRTPGVIRWLKGNGSVEIPRGTHEITRSR
jgi:hypothetical protein